MEQSGIQRPNVSLEPDQLHRMELVAAVETLASSIEDEDERVWFTLELSKALTTARQWDKAEAVAQLMDEFFPQHNQEHAMALLALASSLIFFGQEGKAMLVIEKAVRSTRNIESMWQRAELLCKSAELLANTGVKEQSQVLLEEAMLAARVGEKSSSVQDSVDSSKVLREISLSVAIGGHQIEAKNIAQQIANEGVKCHALADIQNMGNST